MKHAMKTPEIKSSEIQKHLDLVKEIVATFNHASFNDDLPDRLKLI